MAAVRVGCSLATYLPKLRIAAMEWQEKTGAPAEYLRAAYDPKTKQAEELVIIKLLSYVATFTAGFLFWYGLAYAVVALSHYLWRVL